MYTYRYVYIAMICMYISVYMDTCINSYSFM